MTSVSVDRFEPEYSIPGYSSIDALSLCLASRLAYSKLTNGKIDEQTIRRQVTNGWGFDKVEIFEIARGP